MTVFAYHTPYIASPINDRRAGTYRIGSNTPDPIQINKGWDAVLYFAFRNHLQRPFHVHGRSVLGRLYNMENVEVWSGEMVSDVLTDGAAQLIINSVTTSAFLPGLYSLIIEYDDDRGRTLIANTSQSLNRFVVEVLDKTTLSLNI